MNNRRGNSHDTRERGRDPHSRKALSGSRMRGDTLSQVSWSAPSWPPSRQWHLPTRLNLNLCPPSNSSHGPGTVTTAQEVGIRRRSGGAAAVCKHCKIASHAGRLLACLVVSQIADPHTKHFTYSAPPVTVPAAIRLFFRHTFLLSIGFDDDNDETGETISQSPCAA